MNINNISPFYIGQEVVAVKNSRNKAIIKGNKYTVKSLYQCEKCGIWLIELTDFNELCAGTRCTCGVVHYIANTRYFHYTLFAPLHSTFQSISFEKVIEQEQTLVGVN